MNINREKGLKNNCKGSHVGVMLSFVIFVSFLLFFYLIVQPTVTRQEKQSFLDSVEARLIEEASAELKSVSVKINDVAVESDCFRLNDFLSESGMEERIIATDEDGENLTVDVAEDHLEIEDSGSSFIKIYESDEFEEAGGSLGDCLELNEGSEYNIGTLKSDKEIFESRIIEIAGKYKNNLNGLKENLSIISVNEFDFSFTYSNGTEISVGQENILDLDVYVSSSQIQYISREGSREIGSLSVRVW